MKPTAFPAIVSSAPANERHGHPTIRLDVALPLDGVTVVAAPPLAVTDESAEERAGVPGAMLRKWCRRGLRHVRQGARVVVLLDDLRAYLEARATAAPALPGLAPEDAVDAALVAAGGKRARP